MGILDAFNSISDLRTQKHDRLLREQESRAPIVHARAEAERIAAEKRRIDAETEMKKQRLNHEIAMDHEKIRRELAMTNAEFAVLNQYAKLNADIAYRGVRVRIPRATVTQVEQAALPPAAELPGRLDFVEILESWRPSQQQIFLGLAPGGEFVTVPLPALCHVALAGSTGAGKSNLMRMLLAQLLFVGSHVVIADPHYTSVDIESGEDWRPIERRLAIEPAVSAKEIKDVLKWAAVDALPKRLKQRRRGVSVGKPIFIAMDELPSIIAKVPEAPSYMGEIGREGRKVGVYLVSSAQDFLVKTIGGTGAARDNFRTALYSGGDATTARVLLDVKGNPDDGSLGKGIVLARSQAQPQAALMRVPYVSNQALYRLLPTSSSTSEPTSEPLRFEPTGRVIEATRETSEVALDARSLRVRDMLKSRMSQRQIIKELYGIDGGAKYQEAAKELAEIISKLV